MRKFVGLTKALQTAALALAVVAVATGAIVAQQSGLPLDPTRERGTSITPAFEGWYPNPDGTFSILFGYYNRNGRQTFDIPLGPNNKIEPGPPDQGQPTYFEIGRQWGVFAIKVPKDFGAKTLTWTIVSNGEKQAIPFGLNKAYTISPLREIGMGNAPPVLSFAAGGPKFTGPPTTVAATFTGKANQPIALNVWSEDPKGSDQENARSAGNLSFHKYRGPGKVTFDKARIAVAKQGDMVTANATFDTPGEYLLRVQANDESGEGGGGFQCCWTNAYVKVTVN
jgi:hypothetical protein